MCFLYRENFRKFVVYKQKMRYNRTARQKLIFLERKTMIRFGKNEIFLRQGDITLSDAECIVNAANRSLSGGGGVDGAIHRAAGGELLKECMTLGGCETGEAKITKGYRLKAKYVVHTVGPVYSGTKEDERLLFSCYTNALNLAEKYGVKSIEFPCISTGVYGYPVGAAAKTAMAAIKDWCVANPDYGMKITFCCFESRFFAAYEKFFERNV